METRLQRQLDQVAGRVAAERRERISFFVWLVFAGLAAGVLYWGALPVPGFVVVAAATVLAFITLLALRYTTSRPRDEERVELARRIEAVHPELRSALLAATELEPDLPDGRYGYLSKRLLGEVLRNARQRPWGDVVPQGRMSRSRWMHAIGIVAFVVCGVLMLQWQPARTIVVVDESGRELTALPLPDVVVLPGDTEVERGQSVLVSAEFPKGRVPDQAQLVVEGGEVEQRRLEMARSLDDPLFGVRLSDVQSDLAYRIEWKDGVTDTFQITVFEHPELVRSDIVLAYPAYTSLEERRIEDTRRATAPEGTRVTLDCYLNKPVVSAQLGDTETGATLELEPVDREPVAGESKSWLYRAQFELARSQRLVLALADERGRANQRRTEFFFRVTENRRPVVRVSGALERVSPLEELTVGAKVSDDYQLERFGVSFGVGGDDPVELVLGNSAREGELEHTIALEDLAVEPAQLVSYHFWAEDRGTDGEVRRTAGDLYLAEVRPFEEIFREGQQPPGGGGGGGAAGGEGGAGAGEAAVSQRDVVLASWNVLRRDEADEGDLLEELDVVSEAQRGVREQVGAVGAQLMQQGGGPEVEALVELANEHIDKALTELQRAVEERSSAPIDDALPHEQNAYQALLGLQEHEFQIMRANAESSQQAGGNRANAQGGPSQATLRELQLDGSENRYETERQASAADEGRETRQARNRLKDLARRQEDLNERLRELQSELEQARSEAEREEIRRRLKRLQESQEEILRDTDELRQRMDESDQSSRLAQQRQQLDQTRENVRRASEALQEGQLSQALTEGSRARRELEELEQEMRDAAGSQFGQRVRDLEREARRLERNAEELARRLQEAEESDRTSLRGSGERDELEAAFEQQERDVDAILEDVAETVHDAEETEPLLAEELFDGLDEARRARLEEAVEIAHDLMERGFPEQALEAEQVAREGLSGLRERIEGAAESVLGSGLEALERAENELERLSEELDSELAEATGRARGPEDAGGSEAGERPAGERPAGEPAQGSTAEGQTSEGQPTAGEAEEPAAEELAEGQPGQGQPSERGGEASTTAQGGGQRRAPRSLRGSNENSEDSATVEAPGGRGRGGLGNPLTGGDFLEWSDRLRDVEEMVDDPELSAEAARIRSRARSVREEYKRNSLEPNWDLVEEKIAKPLGELHRRVSEEVRRRRADDALVPLDRDPVPPQFEDAVRRYYENLGRGD